MNFPPYDLFEDIVTKSYMVGKYKRLTLKNGGHSAQGSLQEKH